MEDAVQSTQDPTHLRALAERFRPAFFATDVVSPHHCLVLNCKVFVPCGLKDCPLWIKAPYLLNCGYRFATRTSTKHPNRILGQVASFFGLRRTAAAKRVRLLLERVARDVLKVYVRQHAHLKLRYCRYCYRTDSLYPMSDGTYICTTACQPPNYKEELVTLEETFGAPAPVVVKLAIDLFGNDLRRLSPVLGLSLTRVADLVDRLNLI